MMKLLVARSQPLLGSTNIVFDNAIVVELPYGREKQFEMITEKIGYFVLVSGDFEAKFQDIPVTSDIQFLDEIASNKDYATHEMLSLIEMYKV